MQTANIEHQYAWFQYYRAGADHTRFRRGVRIARLMRDSRYGAGVVDAIAMNTGHSRSSLYEYKDVASFLIRWHGLSARRIFDDPLWSALSYTHYREALKLQDFESSIAVLYDALEGSEYWNDEEWQQFGHLPMTVDTFRRYIAHIMGDTPAPPPLFKKRGKAEQVVKMFQDFITKQYNWRNREVEIIVRWK